MPERIHKKDFIRKIDFPLEISQGNSETADFTVINHCHDFEELVAIRKGTGIHIIDDKPYPVQRGDVFFIRKDQSHYFKERKGMEHINIAFDRQDLPLPFMELRQMPGYQGIFELEPEIRKKTSRIGYLQLSPETFSKFHLIISEIMSSQKEEQTPSRYEIFVQFQRVLILLINAYSERSKPNNTHLIRLSGLLSYLAANYTMQHSIEDLAKRVSMSRSTFMRHFKEAVGVTPIAYVNQLRTEAAAMLIRESSFTLKEISERTGFDDSNYFSRTFKRIMSLSPREYREKHKQSN